VSGVSGFPSVSACFPAYNEAPTITAVLDEADELLRTSGLDYEILVCDDGSRDGTAEAIERIAARVVNLRVLKHATNLGIRETFEHLYHEAQKEFVFLNSTDGQWDTRVLFDLLPLAGEWDVIVAARRDKHYGLSRRLVSWGFNAVPRLIFGVRTGDAGAVKLVRREIIERFSLVSRSPFSEAERLIRASRAGYRITERVTDTRPRRAGRPRGVSPQLVIEALRDVARVRRSLSGPARTATGTDHPIDEQRAESSHADQS
jgi:glycosyltransferase involved in cell wall biosynthesis